MAAEDLSDEQLRELRQLAAEPDEKDTMTLSEFIRATDKWRINKSGENPKG
jgi:hypothetical protein